jgi:Fe-S cluster assembly protein SufB
LISPGLNKYIVRQISAKNNEPQWLLDFRLKAFLSFQKQLDQNLQPDWANLDIKPINFQDIIYFAGIKPNSKLPSLDEFKKQWMSFLDE